MDDYPNGSLRDQVTLIRERQAAAGRSVKAADGLCADLLVVAHQQAHDPNRSAGERAKARKEYTTVIKEVLAGGRGSAYQGWLRFIHLWAATAPPNDPAWVPDQDAVLRNMRNLFRWTTEAGDTRSAADQAQQLFADLTDTPRDTAWDVIAQRAAAAEATAKQARFNKRAADQAASVANAISTACAAVEDAAVAATSATAAVDAGVASPAKGDLVRLQNAVKALGDAVRPLAERLG